MAAPPPPLPPDLSRRILQQFHSYPVGTERTVAEIAGQMVGMDPQSLLGYLRAMASAGLVLADSWPADQKTKWRTG